MKSIATHLAIVPPGASHARKSCITRQNSAFTAQLLAGKLGAQISRRLRRMDPAEALSRYNPDPTKRRTAVLGAGVIA